MRLTPKILTNISKIIILSLFLNNRKTSPNPPRTTYIFILIQTRSSNRSAETKRKQVCMLGLMGLACLLSGCNSYPETDANFNCRKRQWRRWLLTSWTDNTPFLFCAVKCECAFVDQLFIFEMCFFQILLWLEYCWTHKHHDTSQQNSRAEVKNNKSKCAHFFSVSVLFKQKSPSNWVWSMFFWNYLLPMGNESAKTTVPQRFFLRWTTTQLHLILCRYGWFGSW